MDSGSYAIGQAVFIRTDTPDFEEKTFPFASMEELVRLCTQPKPNLTLEKIIIHCLSEQHSTAVTLGFISATMGSRSKGQATEKAKPATTTTTLPY